MLMDPWPWRTPGNGRIAQNALLIKEGTVKPLDLRAQVFRRHPQLVDDDLRRVGAETQSDRRAAVGLAQTIVAMAKTDLGSVLIGGAIPLPGGQKTVDGGQIEGLPLLGGIEGTVGVAGVRMDDQGSLTRTALRPRGKPLVKISLMGVQGRLQGGQIGEGRAD